MKNDIILIQKLLCIAYNVQFFPSPENMIAGVSLNVKKKLYPINGFRHPPEGHTTGWYIWSGDQLSEDIDFFKPVHVIHLTEWCPDVLKFLGLPPGWRFLIAEEYEDVWFDESLLDI